MRSLKPGGLASDSRIRVIRERAGVVLTTNLRCDATEPGSWAGKIRSGGHIAAGTKVMSFLIHANGSGRGTLHLSGGVTFETPILGLIIGNELLDASDGAVGLEGVEYPHGGQLRGWFDGDGDDRITLSEDRRTVSVVSHTGRWVDQVRVITAADR